MAERDGGQPLSGGVEALVRRLRDDGVAAGRAEADRLVEAARARAAEIEAGAERAARERLEAAKREVDAYRRAGEDALRTAMRDALLTLKATLLDRFSADVGRLIANQMADPDVLRQLILTVAGRAADGAGLEGAARVTIRLPETAVDLESLRRDPEALRGAPLTGLVLGLAREMLRDGVDLQMDEAVGAGIRIDADDRGVTLDLSDEAVAALLLRHLQPRFRALLEGVVS